MGLIDSRCCMDALSVEAGTDLVSWIHRCLTFLVQKSEELTLKYIKLVRHI